MILWKLDDLMRARGIKGRELARRMNIGENYLSRVRHEVPDRLSLTLLDALCRELGCGIGDLLEYKPSGRARKAAPRPKALTLPVAAPETVDLAPPAPEAAFDEDSSFVADVLAPLFEELAPAPAPEAPKESAPPASGGAVLRTSALQAKLAQLKRKRLDV